MDRFISSIIRRVRRKRFAGWLPPIAVAGC